MKAEEAITKSEDIHRMLLNMALAPISTSIAAYKTAIKEITAYIDELEGKQVPKKPQKFRYETGFEVYRGDVFYIRNVKDYFTGDNKPERPAIVVSNDTGNHFSQLIEVVFLTSKTDMKMLPTHVEIICKVPSIAKCEQIETVSKDRLVAFIRSCNASEMAAIDEALMI